MRKIKLLTSRNAIPLTRCLFNPFSASQTVNDVNDDDSVYLLMSLVTAKRQLQTGTEERKIH
jgi:hypothetical protein